MFCIKNFINWISLKEIINWTLTLTWLNFYANLLPYELGFFTSDFTVKYLYKYTK